MQLFTLRIPIFLGRPLVLLGSEKFAVFESQYILKAGEHLKPVGWYYGFNANISFMFQAIKNLYNANISFTF